MTLKDEDGMENLQQLNEGLDKKAKEEQTPK